MTHQENTHSKPKNSTLRSVLWFVLICFFLVFVFLLLATFSAPVQTRIIKSYLNQISKDIPQEFAIDEVSFHPTKGAVINELVVLDHHKDTMLYAQRCYSGLTNNIISVFSNEVFLSDVRLENSFLKIKTHPGEEITNVEQLIGKLDANTNTAQNQTQGSSSKPIKLDIKSVLLDNSAIFIEHVDKGEFIDATIASLDIDIDSLDLNARRFKASNIILDEPYLLRRKEVRNAQVKQASKNADTSTSNTDLNAPDPERQRPAWHISLHHFEVNAGHIANLDEGRQVLDPTFQQIDYGNIDLLDIELNLDEVEWRDRTTFSSKNIVFSGVVPQDDKGYKFEVDKVDLSSEDLDVSDLRIQTGQTDIRQSIALSYDSFADFRRFKDDVFMRVNFDDSTIDFADIIYFLPTLSSTPLIRKNYRKQLNIDGTIKGRVNNFSSKDVSITLEDLIDFKGNVRVKDITNADKSFLSINVQELSTSMYKLEQVIPDFNPPANFYKLGEIDFDGSFSGFVYDFVAKGNLKSRLGNAVLDTRFDLKPGRENALYSGQVDLYNFNLKEWTENEQFGFVTATSKVKNGRGLILDYLYADLEASISQFDFNNYHYSNIQLNGQFDENQFNGAFNIEDENIDFGFDGVLNIKDNLITTNLKAQANRLDLKQLNLTDQELILEGSFDLTLEGSDVSDINGFADVDNLTMLYQGREYNFDSLYVKSEVDLSGNREFKLRSDLVDADVIGNFAPENIPYHFKKTFKENHPSWFDKTGMKFQNRSERLTDKFEFILSVEDSEFFADFVDLKCLEVKNLIATGEVDAAEQRYYVDSQAGNVNCDNLSFYEVDYSLTYLSGRGKTKLLVGNWEVDGQAYNEVLIDGSVSGDSVLVQVKTNELLDSIGLVDIRITGVPAEESINIHFEAEDCQVLGGDWRFSKNNLIVLGKESIEVQDFKFTDGERVVIVDDLDNKGLRTTLKDFDIELINPPINYPNIYFSGLGDVALLVDNVFKPDRVWVETVVPNLYLNDEDYGRLYINASTKNYNDIEGIITIIRKEDNQRVSGNYSLNLETREFAGLIESENLNLTLFEYIIAEGTSDTQGRLDLVATINGTLDDFKLEGEAYIREGQTRVDYIGNLIKFDKQTIRLTNEMVDLSGVEIQDIFGNTATIQGGLRHKLLKDFEADAVITSPRFVGLNTTKKDNPTYHGFAIGAMNIAFDGPFQTIDIGVEATTGEGTILNIPVENSATGFEESFITFIEKEDLIRSTLDTIATNNNLLTGANIEMNISITPQAEVNIIFNEKLNDKIKGRGRGNIQVVSNRTGEFNIFGNYEIEQGEYLFTAWGFVAKPFVVERGGLITWTGDPFNANLNIKAYYDGVRAPLYTFIQEYLVEGTELHSNAQSYRTDVRLQMLLTNTLYNPVVGFDLEFPDLPPEFQSYTNTKLNALRQNEAELNDQVAALLIFQSFIPSNNALGSSFLNGNNLVYSGINTLSEFLSSQISFQLSTLLEQALVENGFLSSIDFELAFANNGLLNEGQFINQGLLPSEIEVHLKPRFNNDRWGLDIGTGYVWQNQLLQTQQYTRNDFVFEYYITEDKRLKMRVYGKYDYDLVTGGSIEREQRYGAGISYRKEFGSLMDLKEDIDRQIKQAQKELEN